MYNINNNNNKVVAIIITTIIILTIHADYSNIPYNISLAGLLM